MYLVDQNFDVISGQVAKNEIFMTSLINSQFESIDLGSVISEIFEFGLSYLVTLEFRAGSEIAIQIVEALNDFSSTIHERFENE